MRTSVSRYRNVLILSAMLAVVMLGFGMVIPIFPFYVERMGASGTELGLLTAISPFMQLFFAPLWGNISDNKGRRPVLVVGMLGYAISMLLYGLSTYLWMLFAARAVGGILSAATLPTAYAYIGDCTDEENRGQAVGILGAAVGLGVILGPGLGGWLAADNLALPFYITSLLAFITLILILLLLPESLRVNVSTTTRGKITPKTRFQNLRRSIASPTGFLLFLAFLVAFGLSNFQSIFGLYALKKFSYSTSQVGLILTAAGAVSSATQGVLTGPLTKRWGESRLIKVTLFAGAISFGLLLLARSFTAVLVTTGLFILPNALTRPAIISLTSKVEAKQQGMAMGLNNSFTSLGRIIGPVWAGFVFDISFDLPYISGGVILLLGFVLSIMWMAKGGEKRSEDSNGHPDQQHADGKAEVPAS